MYLLVDDTSSQNHQLFRHWSMLQVSYPHQLLNYRKKPFAPIDDIALGHLCRRHSVTSIDPLQPQGGENSSDFPLIVTYEIRLSHTLSRPVNLVVQAAHFRCLPLVVLKLPQGDPSQLSRVLHRHAEVPNRCLHFPTE